MSKSKGNFFTVRDVLEGKATGRPVDPAVLRYELLKAHYRSNMNFTRKGLEESAHAVQRLRTAKQTLAARANPEDATKVDLSHPALAGFADALADDLNISGALGAVFQGLASSSKSPDEALAVLAQVDRVLGVIDPSQDKQAYTPQGLDSDQVRGLCQQLDAARSAKDFATADRLRQQLTDAGYEVMTTKQSGTTARRKLA